MARDRQVATWLTAAILGAAVLLIWTVRTGITREVTLGWRPASTTLVYQDIAIFPSGTWPLDTSKAQSWFRTNGTQDHATVYLRTGGYVAGVQGCEADDGHVVDPREDDGPWKPRNCHRWAYSFFNVPETKALIIESSHVR